MTASAATSPEASNSASEAKPSNSELDAPLFYQLLVGELELSTGQAGVAYQVLLDAARRTKDEELFKRVVNIALQARAGDQALSAARAWRESLPASLPAQQMTIQLLALLNRPAEAVEPLRALLVLNPPDQRGAVLAGLPRLFQRAAEPQRVLASFEPLLQSASQQPETRLAAQVVLARLAMAAGDKARALSISQNLARQFPEGDDSLQLALELMPDQPEAERLIEARLKITPDDHKLRLAYGRALARAQRPSDAAREFRAVTLKSPDQLTAWFALGTLELELRQPEAAESALLEYLRRLEASSAEAQEEQAETHMEARQQSWLMLAQAAEQRGDLKAAEAWLIKVDSPQRRFEAQYRRASLMARQGRLPEARRLLQDLPEDSPEATRAKLMAESQLLRDRREWQLAYEVLARATARLPNETDLIYEQSMMAEKLGRLDEMETLLKRVIALKADHHHAYNALGYSLADRNIRLEEARGLIAKALSLVPSEPFIMDSMGWVEFRLGNKEEAQRLLRLAFEARPDAEIAAHLGEVLWASDKQDEARRVWAEGMRRDPKNEALLDTLKRLKVKL
ncbi:tetratricopeptide repeat protein [Paucibacter sp. DJ2R-2]|uniref:tetratricopeptide repeat protein n=1 Tax=Paucibacter sp. DJ2R-2 TaxID=2893558 RepID=UPI0021E3E587|nr:tetratricopeptide repeat protein [Paucibacter sp. DJ2R-2]MCV2420162.1 tetratricopeptide repeat protein [Paucibacter sp. DJ4R-1]MCV2436911.1 tetratricopeptide repeat protein [Paucibacter sp. DJ2R-2]